MTLTPEDGTGLSSANSFVSLAEANLYAEGRLFSDLWLFEGDDKKGAALVMATRLIESAVEWRGSRKTTTQALGWPRIYAVASIDYSTYPTTYTYYADNAVPKGVKDATCELAIQLLAGDRTVDSDSKGIKSVGLGQGAVEVEFNAEDVAELIPEMVALLLRPFGTLISGSGTRFIPVVRG